MSLYVISDLHLSTNEKTNKSMEVFGPAWQDYTERIRKYWNAVVTDDDTVIVPGDVSWALRLEDSLDDFKFIESLPGTKIIGKGNHDFWWSTLSKVNQFFAENDIKSVKILYNNAYRIEDFIICGTRGWFNDEKQQNVVGEVDFDKIVAREAARLEISLEAAKKLQEETPFLPILVFLHFPPVWSGFECRPILDLLHKYNVKKCYFGHIHGNYFVKKCTEFEGIDFILTSADYLKFVPMPIFAEEY